MNGFPSNYKELVNSVRNIFFHYPEFPQKIYFTYVDDDGDEIHVTSDGDLDVIRSWEDGWNLKLWVYPFDYTMQK